MRTIAFWVAGLLGLLVVAALVLWVLLPWLVAPSSGSAPPNPTTGAAPLRILASARPGPGGTESLSLDSAQADDLLAALAGSVTGISAAQAAFASGAITLTVWGALPPTLPVGRLAGRPFEVQARIAPRLVAPGVVDLSLTGLRLGRVPLTAMIPPATLLRALAPRGGASWWRIAGATVSLDLTKAPPIVAAPLRLQLVPTALAVVGGTLEVTLRSDASIILDPNTLTQTLAQAFMAQGVAVAPRLQFFPGSAEVTLITGSGAALSVQHIGLTVSVLRPGLLQIDTSGISPEAAAADLVQAAGVMPPWLSVGAQGLAVDFSRVQPVSIGSGVHLRLLPTAATLSPQGLQAQLEVVPQSG